MSLCVLNIISMITQDRLLHRPLTILFVIAQPFQDSHYSRPFVVPKTAGGTPTLSSSAHSAINTFRSFFRQDFLLTGE